MARPSKRPKLLSDGAESSGDENPEQVSSTGNGFKVNQEYAKRFEHNKKREEKHRLEEKYRKPTNGSSRRRAVQEEEESEEEDSEDDESEDDEGELATKDVDDDILATLNAIRSKDPRVYDTKVKFYKDLEEDDDAVGSADVKKEKPMFLQDYHRQNLLSGHAGHDAHGVEPAPRTYQDEQDEARRDLVGVTKAVAEDSANEDDGFLVAKPKSKVAAQSDAQETAAPRITDRDVSTADKDPETYLSNFMAARAWVPTSTSNFQAFDSDDTDAEERADKFEEAYNLRFEDPATANETLRSFARDTAKYSVRRDEKKSRKRTRDKEREQKEFMKREKEEEKARLRKLRIEEVEGKVERIREAAGLRGEDVKLEEWRDVLEGDFEDDVWEKEMTRRFGDDYYNAHEDGAGRKKVKKPKWKDDIDIGDLVPDFEAEEKDGKPAFTLSSQDEGEHSEAEHASGPVVSVSKSSSTSKANARRLAREQRNQIASLVESQLPVLTTNPDNTSAPFRYRDTSPTSFGLTARDILFADDKQLNEYVGLKKMATWRDEGKKAKEKKRLGKKGRLRMWRREVFGNGEGPTVEQVDDLLTKPSQKGEEQHLNVKDGERKKKRKRGGKNKVEIKP